MTALTMPANEAATRLGIGVDLLYKKVAAGKWPCHRLGRKIRFTEGDLEAILAICAETPAESTPHGVSSRSAAYLRRGVA